MFDLCKTQLGTTLETHSTITVTVFYYSGLLANGTTCPKVLNLKNTLSLFR